MRSSKLVSVAVPLVAYAAGVTAHFDWVHELDDCWQDCLKDHGCSSQKCICDASATDSYLQDSLECVKSGCDSADWLQLGLLAPLQMFCAASGDSIPDAIIDNAYECATATSAPTPSHKAQSSATATATHRGSNGLRETTTSIFTQTTTDSSGHTLQLEAPIVMGPEIMSTGKVITSTLENPSSTATSAPASAITTAALTVVEPTQLQGASSSSPTAEPTQKGSSGSNGSPFENMQAAATRFGLSGAAIGLGLVAGVFVAW